MICPMKFNKSTQYNKLDDFNSVENECEKSSCAWWVEANQGRCAINSIALDLWQCADELGNIRNKMPY